MSEPKLIKPEWPAPANVAALFSTRLGGASQAPFTSFNLGLHVGDEPAHVAANRAALRQLLPGEPVWLNQVHGTHVVDADGHPSTPDADASVARQPGTVCAVMTADCLPVLLCDRAGCVVAAAHAGWRGLLNGVLEQTVDAMGAPPEQLMAWLGPAIGPDAFEVGAEVREAFVALDPAADDGFEPIPEGKYLADIYLLARQRLRRMGVTDIHGGEHCTVIERERFFSYRRDGRTGRMAALIWLRPQG
ncbi:peptidoglycan editing factor PgeF [Chitinivorax sp. PXF-14]|uniref:peptidoglycan editing factor PgeF n=1 Tax=Chitinivorax sp. PXF-14 TaxID=3230488 RepID=UPI003464E948